MPSPQVLHITSTLTMGDRTVTALQVGPPPSPPPPFLPPPPNSRNAPL